MSVLPRGFGGGQRGTAATRREVSLHTVGCTYVLYRQFNDCVIQTGLTVWDLLSPPLPPTRDKSTGKRGVHPASATSVQTMHGWLGRDAIHPAPGCVCPHTLCGPRPGFAIQRPPHPAQGASRPSEPPPLHRPPPSLALPRLASGMGPPPPRAGGPPWGRAPPPAGSGECQRGGAGMRWISIIIHRPPMIDGHMVGNGRDLGCPDDAQVHT